MTKSSKQKRIEANLKKTILQFMKGRRYRPMSSSELQERLQFLSEATPLFQKIVKELVSEGEIEVRQKKLSLLNFRAIDLHEQESTFPSHECTRSNDIIVKSRGVVILRVSRFIGNDLLICVLSCHVGTQSANAVSRDLGRWMLPSRETVS